MSQEIRVWFKVPLACNVFIFLSWWMTYLEGEVGAEIWHAPCAGRSWSETVRSGPSWRLGAGKGMRNRVTLTDSGLGRWCQFLDQGHDMFLAQYSLECCKDLSFYISASPLWDFKFILHKIEKSLSSVPGQWLVPEGSSPHPRQRQKEEREGRWGGARKW